MTLGHGLTKIDLHNGFCMSFGSAVTVCVCTILNMPVSTTHCQVGAVIFVGAVKYGIANVSWGMFGRIALTWVITLPFAALLSAALTALFRLAVQT